MFAPDLIELLWVLRLLDLLLVAALSNVRYVCGNEEKYPEEEESDRYDK